MTEKKWRARIKKACRDNGNYRESFDPTIEALAITLAIRDTAWEEYLASGEGVIVEHTNKGGATNKERHPALSTVDKMNTTALGYFTSLGLNQKGLKAIDENAMKSRKTTSLSEVLKSLEL